MYRSAMAAISMDGNDRGRRVAQRCRPTVPTAVMSFRVRNAPIDPDETSGVRTPTAFGYHLLRLREDAGYPSNNAFARAAGVAPATISRLIYDGVERPKVDTLHQLAEALVPATPKAGRADRVADVHNDLLHAAGYRIGDAPEPRQLHPLALELDSMLGEGSPLAEKDQVTIALLVDRVLAPARDAIAKARRKRTG